MQVLGGTGQVGDYSVKPRAEDRNSIWQRCLKLMPSLEKVSMHSMLTISTLYNHCCLSRLASVVDQIMCVELKLHLHLSILLIEQDTASLLHSPGLLTC